MSSVQDKAMELALESVQLAGAYKALKAENERLHERVKDLERQLADAYARIAEMSNGTVVNVDEILEARSRAMLHPLHVDYMPRTAPETADPTPTTSTAK